MPGSGSNILPAAHTDLIYAVIVNEIGLFGGCGLLLVYLLFVARGFKTAMVAGDGFSKLLAAGLSAVFALQVFVIVGGVTKVIPLTGVTLPFVSYGGSSIVANMMLLALLLIVSDHARRDRLRRPGRPGVNRQIGQLFGLSMVLFAVLVAFTSQWSVFGAEALEDNTKNRRPLIEEQQIPRGVIRAANGRVVARSVGSGSGNSRIYRRTYPTGPLFSHAVGYSYVSKGRAGLERSRNDALTGDEGEFGTIFSQLQSQEREGKDVTTTLDQAGQEAALRALGGRKGSIVAIEPQTGPRARDGQHPRVRPQRHPDALRRVQPLQGRAAAQPRHPVAVSPGLDVQGGHRRGGAGQRQVHAASVVDGSSPRNVSGVPLANSGGAGLRPDHA